MDKQMIEQEITRLREKSNIYMNAGRIEEARRIQEEIERLTNQL